jgi:SHS2 domain-containing protein
LEAHWEHFEHGADIGVRGIARTKAGAFEQVALATFAIMTDIGKVTPAIQVGVSCEAPDDELLLVDWLNALISESGACRMAFSRFEVRLNGTRLTARAWGEPIDVERHQPGVEVKGATYTMLGVRREESGDWVAQCVVDV